MTSSKWMRAAPPRYRTLTVCIAAGLYGVNDPTVQHMLRRNDAVDSERLMIRVMG